MFFTTPGIFYTESLKTFVQNEMNTHIMYKVEYELFEQFNDPKRDFVWKIWNIEKKNAFLMNWKNISLENTIALLHSLPRKFQYRVT